VTEDPGVARRRLRGWALALLLGSTGCLVPACSCEEDVRTEIPSLNVRRAPEAPSIDGRLDDDAWERAERTERFVGTMDGSVADPRTTARLLWDDDHLYVAFEVDDDHLRCTFEHDDDRLWEQDVVEIMVDPDGDGRSYVELQLSPTDKVFDTWFDSRRRPQPFGHRDWDSGLLGRAHVSGTVNDDAPDGGWTAEIAVPWSAFEAIATPAGHPSAGDTWRLALYVLDAGPEGQRGAGWSPPLEGDYHVPSRFGRITFAD